MRATLALPVLLGATLAAACTRLPSPEEEGAGAAAYDPAKDPLVNPPSLREPPPGDASRIAEDEWFYATLDGNPDTLNPIFGSSTYEFILSGLLFDGPFSFDAKLEWTLNDSMAESLAESEDHRVWTLRLKPGLKWQDGEPFTAHDIAFSWKEILDDRVPCPAQKPGTDEIELCEAVDERTVRFVHRKALPTSKWNVGFGILPRHLYGKGKEEDPTLKKSAYYTRLNRAPVGNGPYRFVEWKDNDKIVLERWDGYHGPRPHFRRIVLRIIPDTNMQLLSFEKGDTDETRLSAKQFADATVGSEDFRRVGLKAYAPQWAYAYICWNMDGSNPFFQDVRVRRAMTMATNIPLMIRALSYNLPAQCRGIFHPDAPYYNPAVEILPFDLEAAARLLDEAGWRVSEDDGWRWKGPVRFSFTLLIPSGSAVGVDMAAIMQQDLKSIGVEMKTQVMEWATFSQRTRKHEFQASTAAWGTGTDPDSSWNIWRSDQYKDGRNYGGYSNRRVDELFELGRAEFDPERRRGYYREIQKILYDEQPYTFLWNSPILWAFNARIRGVSYSPRGVWNFDPSWRAWWVRKEDAARVPR